jgi:putative methyltransferase (TIGR04325 family)
MDGKIKNLIKGITPPLLYQAINSFRKKHNQFIPCPSASWEEALQRCTGYNSDIIITKVKDSVLKVKQGEAACERDSVLFDRIQYSFPLLAGLLRIALQNDGVLTVLDFGGSLGSSYYQCRGFLSDVKQLRWNIVEQEKFVRCGKELFENNELKFFYKIDECLELEKPNVIILSGVLQCLKDPYHFMQNLLAYNFDHIIIDRTTFLESGDKDILTIQLVPEEIYKASYPVWMFHKSKFTRLFADKYSILTEFDAIDGAIDCRGISAHYQGFILDRQRLA